MNVSPSIRAFVLCCCALAWCPVSNAMQILDTYANGGVVHLIVLNDSGVAVDASTSGIEQVATGFRIPLWWSRAFPATLAPGGMGRLSYGLRRPTPLIGEYAFEIGGAQLRRNLQLNTDPEPLAITSMLYDPSLRTVTVFVRNSGGPTLMVDALSINGIPLAPLAGVVVVHPCDTAPVQAALPDGLEEWADDVPVVLGLQTTGATYYRHAHALRPSGFSVRVGEVLGGLTCPTHHHGPWGKAAQAIFDLPHGSEAHFCRNRLTEGLDALGQCSIRTVVNFQASNPKRGQPDAWLGFQQTAQHAKVRTEPGMVFSLVEAGSNFDGVFAQPTEAPVAVMSPRDLRHTVYASLAAGAKGILFRHTDNVPVEYLQSVETLRAELESLRPWLQTIEPVSLNARCSVEDVQVDTLYAGPETLLLIAQRMSAPLEALPADGVIDFTPPFWFTPGAATEAGGQWRQVAIPSGADPVTLPFPATDETTVWVIHKAP